MDDHFSKDIFTEARKHCAINITTISHSKIRKP
jgi:hypothetical protein